MGLAPLTVLVALATVIVTVFIQTMAFSFIIPRLIKMVKNQEAKKVTMMHNSMVLSAVLVGALVCHVLQMWVWALLFRILGEFDDMRIAMYHSAVNFTTLGYGDIVMSEQWRLLGPLEAANGVLMFGFTTAFSFTVMTQLFKRTPTN